MADIQGLLNEEQIDQLMDAGYLVEEMAGGTDELHYISVFVNCDINDLLSPPLCPECSMLMDYEFEPDQAGYMAQYSCSNCGLSMLIQVEKE